MTTETRIYHPNHRDCPKPAWIGKGDQRLFGHNGLLLWPQGKYECLGHPVTAQERSVLVVKEVANA